MPVKQLNQMQKVSRDLTDELESGVIGLWEDYWSFDRTTSDKDREVPGIIVYEYPYLEIDGDADIKEFVFSPELYDEIRELYSLENLEDAEGQALALPRIEATQDGKPSGRVFVSPQGTKVLADYKEIRKISFETPVIFIDYSRAHACLFLAFLKWRIADIPEAEKLRDLLSDDSNYNGLRFHGHTGKNKFVFNGTLFEVTGKEAKYSEEHKKLLVIKETDKERKEFERLKNLYGADASKEVRRKRERIPEPVRIAVWRRDEGKCVQCGSKENLEYDHVIPFSKGGSNTARNVQLLCEVCNREKSDKI